MVGERIIELKNKILNSLNNINAPVYALWLGGSYTYPYVHSNNDLDFLVVLDTEEINRNGIAFRFYRDITEEYVAENNLDIHFYTKEKIPGGAHYKYCHHFAICLYGEPEEDFDILKENRSEIIEILRTFANKIKLYHIYDIKHWYHIYTQICILKNNSYDLSEEEIDNINILHDRKEEDLEKRKELIDYCKDWLNNQ